MTRYIRLVVLFALVALLAIPTEAQTPHKFTYQAVVRNAQNILVRNRMVGVRLSINKDNESGLLMYRETHLTPTNDNGLFTVAIGEGTDQTGSLTGIDWGNGVYYLVTDVDPQGGDNYTLTSSQQLLSVPYALHCDEFQDLLDVVTNSNRANMRQLKDVEDPTEPQDAVTKIYLDSVVNSVYQIMNSPRRDTATVACASFTWRGHTYTSTGVYLHRMVNAGCGGTCDSVITLRLTINRGTFRSFRDTVCDASYTWTTQKGMHGNGASYSTSGTYYNEYNDEYGCPSADTLVLSVGATTNGVETREACETYTWWGTAYTASIATPTHTYPKANAAGCDSVVTLNLTIKHNTTGTDIQSACDHYTWPANNQNYLASTTEPYPTQTLAQAAANGCDSTVSLQLTINHNDGVIDAQTICNGQTLVWHGTSYTEQVFGVTHSFLDANGCEGDSVLNLTVVPNPTVTLGDIISSNGTAICLGSNTTLTASPTSHSGTVTYAWSPAAGLSATDQASVLATPTANATYTVVATAHTDGCDDATDSKTIALTVKALPTVTLGSISDQTVCAGESATFVALATSSDGEPSYSWSNGTQDATMITSTPGTYTVTATVENDGCSGTDSKTVTLSNESADFTMNNILANGSASTSTNVNANAALTLAANISGTSTATYAWSTSVAGGTDAGTSSSISPSTASAGTTTYYLRVTNTTANGCSTYKDKSISVTVVACSLNPTLSFSSSSYSGNTNANIPVQVSVGTLDGGTNGGYTWEIVSSTASGATINAGSYSYQKNVRATGAGTVTIRCTMHVTKGACEKDVSATATVTVTACSVTLTAINITKTGRGSGGECANIPFALTCTPTYTPSNATVTYQWKRGGPGSTQPSDYGYSNISSTYGIAGATSKICYVKESNGSSSGQTYWYDCEVTVSYGGCSVTKTKKQLTSLGLNVGIYSNGGTGTTYTNSTSSNQSLSRSGTTLTFGSKTASSTYKYVVWFAIPNNTESSNPSNVLWRCFSASNTSKGSGTATVPSSGGGKVYYFNSKNSNTGTCPTSSGTYQATSIVTSPKTYN